ncbi:MAG: YciI family protein, partial [Devosia sp.]
MLYAIIAEDKPGGLEHRLAVRPTHLEHLKTLGDQLVFAGPFLDANEKPCGSLMVIDAPS